MTTLDTRNQSTTNQKENPVPAPTSNPHTLLTKLTGFALIATVIGGLYGAGQHPEAAEWSALAIVAAIGIYLFHKTRAVLWARRNARTVAAR